MLRAQAIGAGVFLPFAIGRLASDSLPGEATLHVVLRDINTEGERHRVVRFRWHPDAASSQAMAVQERVVTEWAACGVACCLLALYTDFRLSHVAAEGDRFDYWVSNGELEIGLEISGTLAGDLNEIEARHRLKTRQLLDNPHNVDGFVAVVGFSAGNAVVSFHRFEEAVR